MGANSRRQTTNFSDGMPVYAKLHTGFMHAQILLGLLCASTGVIQFATLHCDFWRVGVHANFEMSGRAVAIITGANTGVGFHTARALVARGYDVVLACRNRERGELAARKIGLDLTSNVWSGTATFLLLDSSCLHSVVEFATAFQQRFRTLNVLVCNAGINSIGVDAASNTADGYAGIMATNYLGHFLLVQLLLPSIRNAADQSSDAPRPCRIVCLSSVTHRLCTRPDWSSALTKGSPDSYKLSKLAMHMLAYELQRQFASQGIADRIAAIAVNPGGVASDIWRRLPPWLSCVATPLMRCIFLTPEQGSATSIAAATAKDIGGQQLGHGRLQYLTPYHVPASVQLGGPGQAMELPCTIFDSIGPFHGPSLAVSSAMSYDAAIARELWEVSAAAVGKLTGL